MWPKLKETADLVTFTEEIFNGILNFLCSDVLIYSTAYQYFSSYIGEYWKAFIWFGAKWVKTYAFILNKYPQGTEIRIIWN